MKNIQSMYQKILAIPADLLLIQEEGKRHYVLIKDFSSFKYDHTLYRGRKYFCCCCVQPFRTAEKLKSHVNNPCKINGKQMIKMTKKREYVRFKNYERKIKLPFMTYADFESILVPEGNGKQNPDEFYTNKNQKICCL